MIIDIDKDAGEFARGLRDAGVTTVFRYYTRDSLPDVAKRVHPAEAAKLVGAGLRLGAVYESRFGGSAKAYDRETGLKDGVYARAYASHVMRQPPGSYIYFGVDKDAEGDLLKTRFLPYMEAVHSVMTEPNGQPIYGIGVYGCGATCTAMLDRGLATKTWVSESTGHEGSKAFRTSGKWTLDQQHTRTIAGLKGCGLDLSHDGGDIGDFVPD